MVYTEPGWKNYQIRISHLINNSEFIIHYGDEKFSNLRQKCFEHILSLPCQSNKKL